MLITKRFVAGLFIYLLSYFQVVAQTAGLDESILASAEVFENPAKIKLIWKNTLACQSYQVYRKLKTDLDFALVATGLPDTATSWTDNSVEKGIEYEYKIRRLGGQSSWGGSTALAYLSSGIAVAPPAFKGKILLINDTATAHGTLTRNSLWQWKQDVAGEGWEVVQLVVLPSESALSVKQKLLALHQIHHFRTVFILGKVKIPYSGMIAPDGHPDHQGAWPADGFYGDTTTLAWPDETINATGATDQRNRNVPGDGKFDYSMLPEIQLEVGRVDMRNLYMFNMSEWALIKRYLIKNHRFRTGKLKIKDRPMHDDQATGLNFGATAWRNYTALSRNKTIPTNNFANVCTGNFRSTLVAYDYLWSGIWGPGSYTSVGSHQSIRFAIDSFQTVFTSFIGSYFGDWDSPTNNFMRSALGNTGPILTTCWSGRPFWYFHHMGMGESIGYCARLAMNNNNTYDSGPSARGVHINLLGDPTLKMHPIRKIDTLKATQQGEKVLMWWNTPNDSIDGYRIFRKTRNDATFLPIGPAMVVGHTFLDSCAATGTNIYMVRPMRLEISNTGTYYNLGTGTMDTLQVAPAATVQLDSAQAKICTGQPFIFTASVLAPVPGAQFLWRVNNQLVTSTQSNTTTLPQVVDGDTITVQMVMANLCIPGVIDTVLSAPIIISALASPTISITLLGDSLQATTNGSVVGWIFNGETIEGAHNPILYPTETGAYQAIALAQNGCRDTSNAVVVTGSHSLLGPFQIGVFPNPTSEKICLSTNLPTPGKYHVTISNLVGMPVKSIYITNNECISLNTLPAGMYLIRVATPHNTVDLKVVKQ